MIWIGTFPPVRSGGLYRQVFRFDPCHPATRAFHGESSSVPPVALHGNGRSRRLFRQRRRGFRRFRRLGRLRWFERFGRLRRFGRRRRHQPPPVRPGESLGDAGLPEQHERRGCEGDRADLRHAHQLRAGRVDAHRRARLGLLARRRDGIAHAEGGGHLPQRRGVHRTGLRGDVPPLRRLGVRVLRWRRRLRLRVRSPSRSATGSTRFRRRLRDDDPAHADVRAVPA